MSELSLNYTAIGSVPYFEKNAADEALSFIFSEFKDIPFWPQLPHFTREEDMVFQYTQNLCGLVVEENKFYLEQESEEFFTKLEELFFDYETVLSSENLFECEEILDKYSISAPNSNAIEPFLTQLKNHKPKFVKGSITGPFTFSTSICEKDGKCAYYSEILRDVCTKTLCLKALWQVKEFKKAQENATPIIFMDEPSISQIGSCAFLSVENNDVIEMLKTISDALKKFGAISGVHCCGKTDWALVFSSGINVVNFDAFSFSKSVANYSKMVEEFLACGGWLAFGIIPTLDETTLSELNLEGAIEAFEQSVKCFVDKGISKDLILKQSFITPSCGCGSLSIKEAKHALTLTKELSQHLMTQMKAGV